MTIDSGIRRSLAVAAVFAVIGAAYWYLGPYLSLDVLAANEGTLRLFLQHHSVLAFLLGYLGFVAVSLIPGTRGKAILVGWLFGIWQGVLLVNLGLTTAAIIAFLVSRGFFREALQRRYGPYLDRLNIALNRDGLRYLFAFRVLGVAPFSLLNYCCGATQLSLFNFWWTTQLGLLPGNILFVYFGANLPTLGELSEAGIGSVLSPELIVAFALLAFAPFVAHWIQASWQQRRQLKL